MLVKGRGNVDPTHRSDRRLLVGGGGKGVHAYGVCNSVTVEGSGQAICWSLTTSVVFWNPISTCDNYLD